jgi:hypothetical protein
MRERTKRAKFGHAGSNSQDYGIAAGRLAKQGKGKRNGKAMSHTNNNNFAIVGEQRKVKSAVGENVDGGPVKRPLKLKARSNETLSLFEHQQQSADVRRGQR